MEEIVIVEEVVVTTVIAVPDQQQQQTKMRRNTSSVSITTCMETYKSKHNCTAVYRTWLRLYPPAKANKL